MLWKVRKRFEKVWELVDELGWVWQEASGVISPNFGAAPPASGSYLACSTKDEWQQQSSFLRSKISIEIAGREKHSYFY